MHRKMLKLIKEEAKKTGAWRYTKPYIFKPGKCVFSLLKKRKNREKQYLIRYWLRDFKMDKGP